MVQEVVLHPRRAKHNHPVRRGADSGEEEQLVGEARELGADRRTARDDPVGKTGWSKHGRELHQPKDPALPEEGTSWLRIPGKRRSDEDQKRGARQDRNQGQNWGAIQSSRPQLCQVKRHRARLQAGPTSPKGK